MPYVLLVTFTFQDRNTVSLHCAYLFISLIKVSSPPLRCTLISCEFSACLVILLITSFCHYIPSSPNFLEKQKFRNVVGKEKRGSVCELFLTFRDKGLECELHTWWAQISKRLWVTCLHSSHTRAESVLPPRPPPPRENSNGKWNM